MSIIDWLFGRPSAEEKPSVTRDDKERMIQRLQAENEQLRRQEAMNMANREEINRLYREINALKASKPEQLARLTYDELIAEAKKRRSDEQARSARPVQPRQQGTSFQQRLSAPTRSSQRTSYPSHSDSPSMLPAYVGLAAMVSTTAALSSPDCSSSSSSDSGSSSSSSDSSSSSCDSGGGF